MQVLLPSECIKMQPIKIMNQPEKTEPHAKHESIKAKHQKNEPHAEPHAKSHAETHAKTKEAEKNRFRRRKNY